MFCVFSYASNFVVLGLKKTILDTSFDSSSKGEVKSSADKIQNKPFFVFNWFSHLYLCIVESRFLGCQLPL